MRAMIDQKRTYGRNIPEVTAGPKSGGASVDHSFDFCSELDLMKLGSLDAVTHGVKASYSALRRL